MIFDYSLAGLVSIGLLFYLTYALLRPERFERIQLQTTRNLKAYHHDRHWLDSNYSVLRGRRRAGQTARLVHDARLQRRAHLAFSDPGPG